MEKIARIKIPELLEITHVADSFGIFCILTLYKGFSDLYRIAVISGISGSMGFNFEVGSLNFEPGKKFFQTW